MDELNAKAEAPDFWTDSQRAQSLMRERNRLDKSLSAYRSLESEFNDATGLLELAEADNDKGLIAEAEATLSAIYAARGER